jgi:hypothetical protein
MNKAHEQLVYSAETIAIEGCLWAFAVENWQANWYIKLTRQTPVISLHEKLLMFHLMTATACSLRLYGYVSLILMLPTKFLADSRQSDIPLEGKFE